MEQKIEDYERLGLNVRNNKESNTITGRKDIIDEKLQIDYIQKYLKVKNGLDYSKNTIKRFYTAIKSNNLIVLSGLPGTGKTSLVNYFGKGIEAEVRIIPVQSNWTDNQDLLGFYNPIEKYYFSTPFLDTLVEADKNKEKLYFICLDEMNLAKIEYYFSEFLSTLEKNKNEEKIINLYSNFIYDDLYEAVNKIVDNGKRKDELTTEEKNIINQFNMLKRYPAKFTIPENVRFIGTINADESTMELSPKVIDRSFIIELLENKDVTEKNEYNDDDITKNIYISPQQFKFIELKDDEIKNTKAYKIIYKIKEALLKINIILTGRFERHFRQLYSAYKWKDHVEFIDYIISSKILPKVSLTYESENDSSYIEIQNINNMIKKYPISNGKLENMINKSKESKIITYWI